LIVVLSLRSFISIASSSWISLLWFSFLLGTTIVYTSTAHTYLHCGAILLGHQVGRHLCWTKTKISVLGVHFCTVGARNFSQLVKEPGSDSGDPALIRPPLQLRVVGSLLWIWTGWMARCSSGYGIGLGNSMVASSIPGCKMAAKRWMFFYNGYIHYTELAFLCSGTDRHEIWAKNVNRVSSIKLNRRILKIFP